MSNSNLERHIQQDIVARGITDERVLEAFRTVPRSYFVRPEDTDQAFEDKPLSIGYGQTISQPYIVAMMTEVLHLKPEHRVLEIGTGSGYQAAILAQLCEVVYSIEVVPALYNQAMIRFKALGYRNVQLKLGDGYHGWSEFAPYDGIIVTCAPEKVPEPLLQQLAPHGKMVIPVGPERGVQELVLIERGETGLVQTRLLPVAFVPLVRIK
jgi:protein-L-isoaspartate(D-aspartate) O-methyltransferase